MKTKTPVYPIYDNGELHITISKGNRKLGNIPGFNTLPGNEPLALSDGKPLTNIKGTCGNVCKECIEKCYAVRFCKYHYNTTIRAYAKNTVILRNDPDKLRKEIKEWCDKNIVRYFRFHTSGEIETLGQLELYATICRENPDITFYIYTKAFDTLKEWFRSLQTKGANIPENFIINLSEWNGNLSDYINEPYFNQCNIFSYDDGNSEYGNKPHCPAIDRTGHETGITCAQCRRCMKKGNITAVYPH